MSDGLEPGVAAMLDLTRRSDSREETKKTLVWLADLLDSNSLPAAGRAYVANLLRAVADEDFTALLPRAKKQPAPLSVTIYAEVEREKPNHERVKDAHAAVGRRYGIKGMEASTVARIASEGRTSVKRVLRDTIAAGTVERDLIVEITAKRFGINKGVIEALLTD